MHADCFLGYQVSASFNLPTSYQEAHHHLLKGFFAEAGVSSSLQRGCAARACYGTVSLNSSIKRNAVPAMGTSNKSFFCIRRIVSQGGVDSHSHNLAISSSVRRRSCSHAAVPAQLLFNQCGPFIQ